MNPHTITALLSLLVFSGCEQSDKAIQVFNDQIGHRIGLKLQAITKTQTPPQGSSAPSPSPEPITESHRTVNAAFIHELYKVVLQREVRSEDEFQKNMHIMDQGAHFEGIYNGLVHSPEYKSFEKGAASVSAVKTYAELMTQVLLDQKFDPLKIPKPESKEPLSDGQEIKPPQPTDLERASLKAELERDAITKPFFTLKRKLGEEVIKTIELKREYREKMATWYGRFTVSLNKRGVDFGVPERNKLDEYPYYKWALDAEEDRIRWECLVRVHVVMNAAQVK